MWKSTFFPFFPYLVWEIPESADTVRLVVADQREKSLERQRKWIIHKWRTESSRSELGGRRLWRCCQPRAKENDLSEGDVVWEAQPGFEAMVSDRADKQRLVPRGRWYKDNTIIGWVCLTLYRPLKRCSSNTRTWAQKNNSASWCRCYIFRGEARGDR